jgi:hypothetical protein
MADERYRKSLEDKLDFLGYDPRKIHKISERWIEAEYKRQKIVGVIIFISICFILLLNLQYLPIPISQESAILNWITYAISTILGLFYWLITLWRFRQIASPGPRFVYQYAHFLTKTNSIAWILKTGSTLFVFGTVLITYDGEGWAIKLLMTLLISVATWILLNNLLFSPYQRLKNLVLTIQSQ